MRRKSRVVRLPEIKFGLKGFFTVDLIDAKTRRIKRHLEFSNLITDAGLNALATVTLDSLINSYMGVGTGSTAPANSDVALVTEIAPAVSNRTNSNGGVAEVFGAGPADAYWYRRITRNFVEAQANGNLTELGLFTASSAGTLFARQLFKDAIGNPTVITKTIADQLRVTYELRLYSPAADVTVNPLAISGSNYSVTTRAINKAAARAWGSDGSAFGVLVSFSSGFITAAALDSNVLAAATAFPAGTIYAATSNTRSAYVAGNFYVDLTTVFDPADANPAGGIGSLLIQAANTGAVGASGTAFQQGFTPKLPKDNTKRLTLVNRVSWGRYP